MNTKLSTQPVKGFRDFKPEDWRVQQYIFDVWRRVCERYGYDEYNGPVLEYAEIYNKSGEEVGTSGKELYTFTDQGGRKLALRPEMTPTVGRMISEYGKMYSKPIRWFSIAQFFRAENPQRGRGREFYQLNADIFGSTELSADYEALRLTLDMMIAFGAKENMFRLSLNNRKFSDFYFTNVFKIDSAEQKAKLLKLIDAYPKRDDAWMSGALAEETLPVTVEQIKEFLSLKFSDLKQYEAECEAARQVGQLFLLLRDTGYDQYCVFDTSMARGLDYYTGMVFEVFDNNPENKRSMFGGGRYDDLLSLFSNEQMPAVGFAIGDMTLRIFLEGWKLLPASFSSQDTETYYLPLLTEQAFSALQKIATNLRKEGKNVISGLKQQSVSDALRDANKKGCTNVLLIGEEEIKKNIAVDKNLQTGDQKEMAV